MKSSTEMNGDILMQTSYPGVMALDRQQRQILMENFYRGTRSPFPNPSITNPPGDKRIVPLIRHSLLRSKGQFKLSSWVAESPQRMQRDCKHGRLSMAAVLGGKAEFPLLCSVSGSEEDSGSRVKHNYRQGPMWYVSFCGTRDRVRKRWSQAPSRPLRYLLA